VAVSRHGSGSAVRAAREVGQDQKSGLQAEEGRLRRLV
jgi:hypothetical protein